MVKTGVAAGAAGAAAFALALGKGNTLAAALTLALFFGALGAMAAIDGATQEIPDGFHLVFLALGAAACFTLPGLVWYSRLAGMLCVSVPMLLCCLLVPGAFGGGDIKLMFACGLLLGLQNSLLSAFFGVLLGGAWGICLLARRRAGKKDHFAFGPFLAAGMFIAWFWGGGIWQWYLGLCGIA